MKTMKILTLSLVSAFLGSAAFADTVIPNYGDFGVEVGFRQQSASPVASNQTTTSQNGYQLGVVGFIPFSGSPLGLRTGIYYVSRSVKLSNDSTLTAGDATITLTSFDVPLALAYKFSEQGNVFGGVALSINLDNSVSTSGALAGFKNTGVKTPMVPILLGVSFKFMPELGASLFFESSSGNATDQVSNYRAVGANLLITF